MKLETKDENMEQKCETAKEALHRSIVNIEDFLDGTWGGDREDLEATVKSGWAVLRRLTNDDAEMFSRYGVQEIHDK